MRFFFFLYKTREVDADNCTVHINSLICDFHLVVIDAILSYPYLEAVYINLSYLNLS